MKTFSTAAVASILRPGGLSAQQADAKATAAEGSTIYLNPATGADTGSGAKGRPLRTLAEAARRVNQSNASGPMTVVLSEGIYAVGETTLLKPERRSFSKTERLTIRAEVLPDDPEWHTGRMPTLIHTMPLPKTWNGRPDPLGGAADGMMIETSHVSIQGLKILGMPVVETPKPGLIQRLYAISRLRRDLEDLEIAQCLFIGDDLTNPNHVTIIANGNGVNVHHCIFRGLKISVVYWTGGSTGHAMRNCFCDGVYGSGVWTAGIAADFDYRNNVIANCNYAWTYQGGASAQADAGGRGGRPGAASAPVDAGGRRGRQGAPLASAPQELTHYKVVDSYFANNRRLAGSGTGARLEYADMDPSFLELTGTKVTDQPVMFERDQTKRNYLHPVAGSEAAKIGAGLFLRPGA
jgi:hypothetical protein